LMTQDSVIVSFLLLMTNNASHLLWCGSSSSSEWRETKSDGELLDCISRLLLCPSDRQTEEEEEFCVACNERRLWAPTRMYIAAAAVQIHTIRDASGGYTLYWGVWAANWIIASSSSSSFSCFRRWRYEREKMYVKGKKKSDFCSTPLTTE
jgi:hypothetical protein